MSTAVDSHRVNPSPSCTSCRYRRGTECHRSPPVRLPRKFDKEATSGNRVRDETVIWGWPQIRGWDWCGEHAW